MIGVLMLAVVALHAAGLGAKDAPETDVERAAAAAHRSTAPGRPPKCVACHDASSWKSRRFAHDRTGFELRGRHADVACRACHRDSFERRVSTSCANCHADVHVGQLGARCERCHDPDDWTPRDPQLAHRRTNFPLVGRHAVIPCQECHADRRDHGFARPTVACSACHDRDYARASARSVDHQASGFAQDCRTCHSPVAFTPGIFPGHEACFQLEAPPHAGIRCIDCHGRLAGLVATGACFTNHAQCTRCHPCARVSSSHTKVAGFQCRDRKCYECHSFRLR